MVTSAVASGGSRRLKDADRAYAESVGLRRTVDSLVVRVLQERPLTAADACYAVHERAAELYQEAAAAAAAAQQREEEKDGDSSGSGSDDEEEAAGGVLLCGLRRGRIIGRGAFGSVYKALDEIGTVYAVKVLRVRGQKAAEAVAEATAEYSTLRQLHHKNIVSVWDFVAGPKKCEIAMSFWTQGSVAHQMLEFGALPPYTVRKYAIQVLDGLEYLHSCQILHRDLKPGNMLVDCMGSVALTDFGLSTSSLAMGEEAVVSDDAGGSRMMSIVGSPPYISPHISCLGTYSTASDLWAFGCSLLEMATARITWSGAPFGNNNHGWSIATYVAMSQQAMSTGETPLDHVNHDATPVRKELVSFLRTCFKAESEGYAMRTVAEHPFLGRRNYPEKEMCCLEKAPRESWNGTAPVSGPLHIFASARTLLLSEEDRAAAFCRVAGGAVADASPFSFLDIRRAGETRCFNNASVGDPARLYPHRKRPAHALLSMLGRTTRGGGREDIEPGLPHVELAPRLLEAGDDLREIVLSAATIDAVSAEEKRAGLSPDPYIDGDGDGDGDGPSAREVYGTEEFRITIAEVKRLARSTYVATASGIPIKFFQELVRFTSRKELQLFWSAHRAVPLCLVGDPAEEAKLRAVLSEEVRSNTARLEQEVGDGPAAELERHRWRTRKLKAARFLADGLLGGGGGGGEEEESDGHARLYRSLVEQLDAWRQHVLLFPYDLGFSSSADAKAALGKSLTEIGTGVCVSQLGFFLVDGCRGGHNQLTPKTPQPVTFLFASGIDFFSPATVLREAPKYFIKVDEQEHGCAWKGFLPVAQYRLKERIKDSYRAMFNCAKHHGVRNLSMLSMGLGIFLSAVHPDDRCLVREAYFKAQFELLCESDWGFEGYYINPGPPDQKAVAIRALEDTLGGGAGTPAADYLSCDVIFHSCDAKFLAAELAKRRMSAAMLAPSDCASVTMGQVGTFWEQGRGNKYSGEEDFIAHTTGVLAREGIAEFWGSTRDEGEDELS